MIRACNFSMFLTFFRSFLNFKESNGRILRINGCGSNIGNSARHRWTASHGKGYPSQNTPRKMQTVKQQRIIRATMTKERISRTLQVTHSSQLTFKEAVKCAKKARSASQSRHGKARVGGGGGCTCGINTRVIFFENSQFLQSNSVCLFSRKSRILSWDFWLFTKNQQKYSEFFKILRGNGRVCLCET